jgi:hypothetical protein
MVDSFIAVATFLVELATWLVVGITKLIRTISSGAAQKAEHSRGDD